MATTALAPRFAVVLAGDMDTTTPRLETPTTTRLKGIPGLLADLPLVFGRVPESGILMVLENHTGVFATARWHATSAAASADAALFDAIGEQGASMGARSCILIVHRTEPGAVDVDALAERVGVHLDLHHVITVTEAHWWANTCTKGCCDGAVHVRAPMRGVGASTVPHPQQIEGSDALLAAWERLTALPVGASQRRRRARLDDLDVVLQALSCAATRDPILLRLAPELLSVLGGHPMPEGRVMSSRRMAAWRDEIPESARAAWLSATALALWREGKDIRAASTAREALVLHDMSLARLVNEIVVSGLTYKVAVERAGRSALHE